ncbi:hypothetical protein GKZ90_0007930 [Flavobacterium sp. MC2016-06]|uniref:hypothetical protein n=1 Tax=Flavobacterium sp. MC2016-06 TaxID=2676308 RepID=UPI0012BA57B9|nr:hypothetical protein [Flavobacterium sp. MC2016-06]MBU3858041.1 hypothetical protein [Flavobacterium sp. MC2016-06]
MRNIVWSFLVIICVTLSAFSQTKNIEKGSYLSADKGQQIKLNLLEDNKFELVFYSGNYEIKGDSLLFLKNKNAKSIFDLDFKREKNAQKIKVKFQDSDFYSLFIGTQKGSEPVVYQRLSDIKTKIDPAFEKLNVEFDIERADYLYLAYEGYAAETKLSKYALPKDVSEVEIKFEPEIMGDLNLSGFFDKNTKELKISEKQGKNLLVFLNEKDAPPVKEPKVTALENQSISNWTYPGKNALAADDFGIDPPIVDTTAVAVDASPKFIFKLNVENNLKNAIAKTKEAKTKFLVVYTDSKNTTVKADFETFVKDQESQLGYYMYDTYYPDYDVFNYYLATADDKKWLKANKISDNPSIIILNGDGEILTTAKSTLDEQKAKFSYYDDFFKKLQRTNVLYSFNTVLKNKKATDAALISAFNKVAVLDLPYSYDADYTVDNVENPTDFKLDKTAIDKKEVSQIWKKLIEAHQKDAQPNMLLVRTILKEIKNQGFSKQFFSEDRVLNDTDFLAIDYLIKHYDAIEKADVETVNEDAATAKIGNLSTEISSALQMNNNVSQDGVVGNANQNKIISIYKKLITAGKGESECYKNYFAYLTQESETSGNYAVYLKEFDTYFNAYLSPEKGNVIEKLDEMYTALDSSSEYLYDEGWNSFKDYHSNLCNSTAWSVVLKPENASYLKAAIQWSEYSLIVTKNNAYYLDTLAQLYYKDGQKQKAIETQTLAVKFLNVDVEEETASEIRETLNKMQNGTY